MSLIPFCDMYMYVLLKAKSQADVQMKQSEHLVKKMIKKLEKYKSNPAVLEENFPLYVLLVARMHR